ncbi:transferrin-binding protein-like solute binding protein [Qipengyuania flava]|nr:transferrin-binding protein-like solute binding protein [Qipengyuania flava]
MNGQQQGSATAGIVDASIDNDSTDGAIRLSVDGEDFTFAASEAVIRAGNLTRYDRLTTDKQSRLDLVFGQRLAWYSDPQFVKLGQLLEVYGDPANKDVKYRFVDFVFGVPSAPGDIPTTGTAAYALQLSGTRGSSISDVALVMFGDGAALVDFGSGRIDLRGTTADFKFDGRPLSSVDGSSTISASALIGSDGLFTNGAFTANTGSSGTFTGTLGGKFYGPGAGELGGTMIGDANNLFYSLAFTGYEVPDVAESDTLANLRGSNRLETVRRVVDLPDADPNFSEAPIGYDIVYDADTGTYFLGYAVAAEFGPNDRRPAEDGQDLIAYGLTIPRVDGASTYEIGLFDGSTQGITLSYTSFARTLETITDTAGDLVDQQLTYTAFGKSTPADQLPQTGTASYTGALFGDVTDGTQVLSPLRGSSNMQVDFGSMDLTGSLAPVATDLNGATRDFGSFDFAGSIDSFTATFEALFGSAQGSLAGRFYGDRAQEFAATFGIILTDEGLNLEGVTVGKQDRPTR